MVSRELLRDAVKVCATSRGEQVGPVQFQRRMRVGYATAAQLLQALDDAGVLSSIRPGGHRGVLVADEETAHGMVDSAISAGRVELHVVATGSKPSGGEA